MLHKKYHIPSHKEPEHKSDHKEKHEKTPEDIITYVKPEKGSIINAAWQYEVKEQKEEKDEKHKK